MRRDGEVEGVRRLAGRNDGDVAVERLRALGEYEAAVHQGCQTDGRKLERPVVDDTREQPPHGTTRAVVERPGSSSSPEPGAGGAPAPPAPVEAVAEVAPGPPREPGCRGTAAACRPRPTNRPMSASRRDPMTAARPSLAARRPNAPRRLAAGSSSPWIARAETDLGEVAHDPGPFHEADLPVLLRHDDHDGVGLLGDPEGRPVTRPEPLGVDRRLGQRQERAGRHDPLVADDDGAVMERRARHEDRAEQVGRDIRVDHHPGLGDFLEAGLALEHDQRTVALGRQLGGGPRHLRRHELGGPRLGRATATSQTSRHGRSVPAPAAAPAGRSTTRANRPTTAPVLQDLGQQPQLEGDGQAVDDEQDADADDQPDGTGSADQAEQPVDQERRDPDVDDRREAEPFEDRSKELRHRQPSVASPSGLPGSAAQPRPASGADRGQPGLVGEAGGHQAHSRARAPLSPVSSTSRPRSTSLSADSVRQPRSRYSSASARWISGSAGAIASAS